MSAQRIASFLSSATEILSALGLEDQVVGVSHECDFPATVRSKPQLTRSLVDAAQSSLRIDDQVKDHASSGQSLYQIDEQLLCELAPDLIVTQAQCDVCAIKYEDVVELVQSQPSLRQTQIVALSPHSLENVFEDIRRIGRITSRPAAAERFCQRLDARLQHVRRAVDRPNTRRPRVVCIEWVEPLMVAANWTPQLVEFAGGENGLSRAGSHSVYADWNEIIAYDPEVLILTPCGFDLQRTLREVADMPKLAGWQDLTAVQTERVFAIDGNAYFNRSGPRLVETVEILAHLLHPAQCAWPTTIPHAGQVWSVFSG